MLCCDLYMNCLNLAYCQVVGQLVRNLWLFLRRQSCCHWKKLDRRQWRVVPPSGSKCTWTLVVVQPICRQCITLSLIFPKGLCHSVTQITVTACSLMECCHVDDVLPEHMIIGLFRPSGSQCRPIVHQHRSLSQVVHGRPGGLLQ